MIKFADAIETVLGFEVLDATDDGVEYLVKKHPELLMFQLGIKKKIPVSVSKLTSTELISSLSCFKITGSTKIILETNFKMYSKQLQTLDLSGIYGTAIDDVWFLQTLRQIRSTIKFLTLSNSNISGKILSEFNETLPCLENLNLNFCRQLTNKGLLQILQLCGSTVRSLDVFGTQISGETLAEYRDTLPCLVSLNLGSCELSDNGFAQILLLCGSTLRTLAICFTNITGRKLSDYKGTLPCLENLNLSNCKQLSDNGLLQILQICGSTLIFLNVIGTNITAENFSEYNRTRPCLKTLSFGEKSPVFIWY